ncbi:MAG: hypothetical protein JXR25_13300 [Pontiellaceae bacterium]|nr:hypothetical protein [Candidatus Anaeroferrophillacea bacterium]MBN2785791.1 hypothetical protein [Pontiellaceae bacterium]
MFDLITANAPALIGSFTIISLFRNIYVFCLTAWTSRQVTNNLDRFSVRECEELVTSPPLEMSFRDYVILTHDLRKRSPKQLFPATHEKLLVLETAEW